jgi:hypothetical protein
MTWVAAGVASAAVTVKAYQAYKADRNAKNAKKEQDKLRENRPQYTIPEEYQKNIDLQTGIVKGYEPYTKTSQLAGQSYMQNRIDANTANQTALASQQGVSSPSGMAALYGSAMNAQNEATTDMNIKGAENRKDYQQLYANETGNLQKANADMADQKALEWNQNTFSPYASLINEKTNMIRDYTQRSRERADSAIESGTSVGSMAGSGASMYGNGMSASKKGKKNKGSGGFDMNDAQMNTSYSS